MTAAKRGGGRRGIEWGREERKAVKESHRGTRTRAWKWEENCWRILLNGIHTSRKSINR